jgi:hypothetical protein
VADHVRRDHPALGERLHVGAAHRGGDPPSILHKVGQGAELVTDVRRDDQTVDTLWIPPQHVRHDVARVVHDLARAQPTDPGVVLRERGRDDPGAAGSGELHRVRPDTARRADDQLDIALRRLDRLDTVERRDGREPYARRSLEFEVPGLVHHEAVQRHGHELGVGAPPQMRLGRDDAGDLVAEGEPGRALPERVDLARDVLADHDGVPVLHHASGHPLGHEHVEPVDRRRAHLDPNLAWSGLGGRDLDDRSRSSLVRQSERLHPASLASRWFGSPIRRRTTVARVFLPCLSTHDRQIRLRA